MLKNISITRDPSYTKIKSTKESCIIIKNICQSHNNPNNYTAYRQIWVVPLQLIKIYFCLMLYIRTLVINVACFTKGFVTSLFIETWIVTWFVTALSLCNRITFYFILNFFFVCLNYKKACLLVLNGTNITIIQLQKLSVSLGKITSYMYN